MSTGKLLIGVAAGLVLCGNAGAQTAPRMTTGFGGLGGETTGPYLGAGYSYIDIESDQFEDLDESTNAIHARLGYQFLPSLGVEVEGAFGLDDGDFDGDFDEDQFRIDLDGDDELSTVLAGRGRFSVDYLIGVYGKYTLALSEMVQLYGRAGYAYLEAERSFEVSGLDDEVEIEGGESGFAVGGGAAYELNAVSTIRADYTRYEFDETAANGLNVSYQYKFLGY